MTGTAHNPWSTGRIILIVGGEYVLLALVCYLLFRLGNVSLVGLASFGTIAFGVLSLFNFFLAARMTGPAAPADGAGHLKLLREEFLYLRWYFDEVLETMSSGILVLDRVLTVRSMNHAQRHFLALKEKEELIGKPFRYHPLAREVYSGEIYGHRGKPLLEIFESCVRLGESVLLEDIRLERGGGAEARRLDILVYPWKNRNDETERLVIRMDDRSAGGATHQTVDIERLLAGTVPDAADPSPLAGSPGLALLDECETVRDHLEALLTSARSVYEILDPSLEGPHAELLLFEMQVQKIIEMVKKMESELARGAR